MPCGVFLFLAASRRLRHRLHRLPPPHITINTTPSTQHHHLSLVLRDRRSTRSTFIEVGGSLATNEAFGRRLVLWSISGSFCVARAALGAFQALFPWQVQHWKHLSCVFQGISLRLKPSPHHHLHYIFKHTIIKTTPSPQHHQHNLINTTSSTHHHSTQHHLHNTIYTTSSTQHHLHYIIKHNIINTTSSRQLHQHITIYTTPSTIHHQTLAGAALGALPYYPFCLIPTDSLWIVLCSVSLTYSTVGCP